MPTSLRPFALVAAILAATAATRATSVPPTSHGESPKPTAGPAPAASDPTCKIKPIAGLSKATIATSPLVDDPVAFAIDEQGAFYFAESDRQERGVEDNRSSR